MKSIKSVTLSDNWQQLLETLLVTIELPHYIRPGDFDPGVKLWLTKEMGWENHRYQDSISWWRNSMSTTRLESIQWIFKRPTNRFEYNNVWERWHFWISEINIDYRLIQCIRGFCSSPLPIFKLSLQVPWIDSSIPLSVVNASLFMYAIEKGGIVSIEMSNWIR